MTKINEKAVQEIAQRVNTERGAQRQTASEAAVNAAKLEGKQETAKAVTAYSWIFSEAAKGYELSATGANLCAAIETSVNALQAEIFATACKAVNNAAAAVVSASDFVNVNGETIAAAKMWSTRAPKLVEIAQGATYNGTLAATSTTNEEGTKTIGRKSLSIALPDTRVMFENCLQAIKSCELLRADIEKREKAEAQRAAAEALANKIGMPFEKVMQALENGKTLEQIEYFATLFA